MFDNCWCVCWVTTESNHILSKMNKFKVFEKDTQANLFKTKNQINEIALKTYVIKQISKHSFHKKYIFNCYT